MDDTRRKFLVDTFHKLGFLKASIYSIIAWPLACLIIGSLVWGFTLAHLESERESVKRLAFQSARSLARSYADQLSRTVAQIDQHSVSLAYYWKESKGTLQIEKQANKGLYPADASFAVGIIDRNGDSVTSLTKRTYTVNIADRNYFQAHRKGLISGLHFEKVEHGRISGKSVLIFSRALRDDDGNFDGLVNVAVEPEFLVSFYDGSSGRQNDVLVLLSKDGKFIASKTGAGISQRDYLTKQPMTFPTLEGISSWAASEFKDERSRIVAWHGLPDHNFISVVALAEDEIYGAYEALRQHYMGMAAVASILLGLIGIMGSIFLGRLAWRKHQTELVTDTYQLATEGAREGFFMATAIYGRDRTVNDYLVEGCNERGASMLGLTKERLIGMRFSEIYTGKLLAQILSVFDMAMQHGYFEDECRMLHEAGDIWIHRRLVRSGDGIAINLRDITENKTHESALRCMANTDSLTKLHNRHWLASYLPAVLENAGRVNAKVALLYLDLDNFKDVNNTMGHAVGDEVLRQSAQRMQAVVRPGDYVVRLGGDEFAVVLPQVTALDDASNVAARIHEALARPIQIDGNYEHSVCASIGISFFPDDGETMEVLLQHADTAMYAAKNNGKGIFEFYSPVLTSQIVTRINQEKALRQAVNAKQFVLHFQPRVDAVTGELLSMEALVRWQHPERGLISPGEFIALAEESGLIVDIGKVVIDQACAQIASWGKDGLGNVRLSVNVSAKQFIDGDLHGAIASSIARHEIPARNLEVEITESCMMRDNAAVAKDIAAIKQLGIEISVDDFGTGYSSLSQLMLLDLDVIKVDQAFTKELVSGKHGKDFFTTIISMARTLEMQVVAEGVETAEQLAVLRQLGCDEVQGYFISRPVPSNEAAMLIRKRFLLPVPAQLHFQNIA